MVQIFRPPPATFTDALLTLCAGKSCLKDALPDKLLCKECSAKHESHQLEKEKARKKHHYLRCKRYAEGNLPLLNGISVYFIQSGDNGPIKIGITEDVKRRVKDISALNPNAVTLLAYCGGGKELEELLHLAFSAERIKNEWFEPSNRILEVIEIAKSDLPQNIYKEIETYLKP